MKPILFLITGGTIDSHWEGKSDTAVIDEHSSLPDYFKSLILYAQIEFKEICMKDSRQIEQTDRDALCVAVESAPNERIIVTHGTYTMPDTARYLKANLKRKDQTIVPTGSMVPLQGFVPSDAPFNLGYAVSEVQNLQPGVYLCMNGRTFEPETVAKDIKEGKFFSVFDKQQ